MLRSVAGPAVAAAGKSSQAGGKSGAFLISLPPLRPRYHWFGAAVVRECPLARHFVAEVSLLHYRIQPSRPEAHVFTVSLTLPQTQPEGQVLRMPAWIPGSYMIRDFARHVVSFDARAGDTALDWYKLDKDSWQLAPCDGPVIVTIEVYAWDLSVRGAHLDTTHGYFNGTCVFLQPIGFEDQPVTVSIAAPEGASYATWQVATGLERADAKPWGFGDYRAANYDELIDCPVEMGLFERVSFDACGVTHHMVFTGRFEADLERIARDLKPVCEAQIRLFGEPAPFDDYLFMTLVTGDGYGGLEHRNSTSLMCSRNDLPRRTDAAGSQRDAYRQFLGLCSHEYFHSWNIKRIKPAAFTPYDLTRENYTELLWAFEGITSYYDDLMLLRSGAISLNSYLELLGQIITRVARGSGSSRQTVTESSFDAWARFYKQDENAPNAIVSYYAKGALVALGLDLALRERTHGEKSLDDLMRVLWQRYGQTGEGVPENGIQAAAEGLIGAPMADFFEPALYGRDDLPLAQWLAPMGLKLNWRPAASHADMGGKPAPVAPVNLGIRVADDALGARIAVAHDQGAAMAAGLSAGDVIIAIDGVRVDARRLEDLLAGRQPGEVAEVHAFRRDELMRFRVTLQTGDATTAWLEVDGAGLTEAGRRWLNVD